MRSSTEARSPRLWLLVATAVIVFRLWTSFCFFPVPEWNSVRLTPSFMLRFGVSPYPGLDVGPLTTWIYGPVPLLLNFPATFGSDVIAATLISGAINLLVTVIPLIIAVRCYRSANGPLPFAAELWIVVACLALWPNPSLHYIQSDNAALAFGLVSNAMLSLAGASSIGLRLVAAATLALAVWSKQTAIGLAIAQLIWMRVAFGSRAALHYGVIQLLALLLLGAVFVARIGFQGVWLNVVAIPGRIPWCEDFGERALLLWKDISIGIVAPAASLLYFRRAILQRSSPWLLPFLSWLCLLPMAVVSIFKAGGASNSLNGYLYLTVPAAAAVLTLVVQRAANRAHALLAVTIFALTELQLHAAPYVPLKPVTRHLSEAMYLAHVLPHRVYFPWHPLVTWYSDRRFYHAEDGLLTRRLAGLDRATEATRADFPPHWSVTAVPGWRENGVFRSYQNDTAELNFFGKWSLFSWGPNRLTVPLQAPAGVKD